MRTIHIIWCTFILLQTGCRAQTTDTVFNADSTPVYYRTFGSGKPLLIINGGPGMNSDGFQGLARELSKNNWTIIYDQRGTGRSLPEKIDTSTITMKGMMEDMEALRKHLKIEKWSILGHSFGGMVASYYATQYPENIDKLILSSSGGIDLSLLNYARNAIDSKLTREDLDSVQYWTQKISDGDTTYHARYERGKHLAPAYVIDKKFIPVIADRLTQSNTEVNQLMWDHLRKINFDCAEGLKKFDRPVLIIQGKEDIIKEETVEKARKAFKNSRVVYMEHCNHYGWLDNPEVYFAEINSFLGSK